jgi:hypothetical protein
MLFMRAAQYQKCKTTSRTWSTKPTLQEDTIQKGAVQSTLPNQDAGSASKTPDAFMTDIYCKKPLDNVLLKLLHPRASATAPCS